LGLGSVEHVEPLGQLHEDAKVIGTVEDHGAPPVIICGFYALASAIPGA